MQNIAMENNFDLPFISQNPSEQEKHFAHWFNKMRKAGILYAGFGFHGIRIRMYFQKNEVLIGNILLTPETQLIFARHNLDEIEVAIDSALAYDKRPIPHTFAEIFDGTCWSYEEIVRDFVNKKEENVFYRNEIMRMCAQLPQPFTPNR